MKTYYQQIKNILLFEKRCLRSNTSQLTEHDKDALRGYKGAFLHASRKDGTDIVLLDKVLPDSAFRAAIVKLTRKENTVFLLGHARMVHHVTRSEVIERLETYAYRMAVKAADRDIASCLGVETPLHHSQYHAVHLHTYMTAVHECAVREDLLGVA